MIYEPHLISMLSHRVIPFCEEIDSLIRTLSLMGSSALPGGQCPNSALDPNENSSIARQTLINSEGSHRCT